MAMFAGWLRPPGTLLLGLVLLTVVSVSAVGWFGWTLLEQERFVESQRSQERLEQEADRVVASVRRALAETGDSLGAGQSPGSDLVLQWKDNSLTVTPGGRLLYHPFPSSEPEAAATTFAEAELFEFLHGQPDEALLIYQRLEASKQPEVRAGALLRIARVLRVLGRTVESKAAYERLAIAPVAKVAGVPSDLVARTELFRLSGRPAEADSLRRDLIHGRWQLTRGQFEFYWSEVSPQDQMPPAEAVILSELAGRVWEARTRNTGTRGQESLWISGRPYFLIWRGSPERRSVLIAQAESFLKSAFNTEGVIYAAVDADGRLLAGRRQGNSRAAVRAAAESELPWTIYVSDSQPASHAGLIQKQRFLLAGILVMVLFLTCGTYLIARAIRREAEVLRMQSDFVSAVSHEFRSPLTSLRQLSEILALGRVPSEERRQLYYHTLVKETTRLQRVVEALLNFGKMEAGARQYRFEHLDASQLVRQVVAEFEPQMAASGRRIEVHGIEAECLIDADPDAICVALRNLLDNAVKYSPGQPAVWVECGVEQKRIAIKVRDEGPGIPESERKSIFRKFVRGSAASAGNVKGSGVGLAMVRHIADAHGGEVTLVSRTGGGSTFTLLLPSAERT